MTFEEEFPSICNSIIITEENIKAGFGFDKIAYPPDMITRYCIDKQRHEELMEQALAEERQRVREAIKNLQVRLKEGNYLDEEGDVIEDCKFRAVRSILYEELGL